ncbi:MAG: hypothetical protein M1308_12865, partial [Actinobacteria bacterium]|nr:hypothetical protein [Actinomycetota bacterium]
MAIDQHYIPAFSIEDVLLDKDTGAPLTGGLVYFYRDSQRTVLKPVYQITGTSPNYSYIELPNPMTLSAIGTFEDSLGNPVIPYFKPFVADTDTPDYYFVRVLSSGLVEQFTREAVPYIPDLGSNTVIASAFDNEISNPQFAEVYFDTTPTNYTYNFNAASSQVVSIAPDWDIVVSSVGAATVTVKQLTVQGSLNRITNPGTLLNITSAGVSSLLLRQRIYGSPNLWGSGNISATFIAKTYSGSDTTLKLYYSQSNGVVVNQQLVSATLPASGSYAAYPGNVTIPASTSSQSYPQAYIDIFFDIPPSIQIDISSVMVVSTGNADVPNIVYDQESNNRQIDHLFHDYKAPLSFKPIKSYLTGWDFPLNPAQFSSASSSRAVAAQAIGAKKAYYAWDQTILFQTVDSGITVGNNSNLHLTANNTTKMAIVQYLGSAQALKIFYQALINKLSVNIRASSTVQQNLNVS